MTRNNHDLQLLQTLATHDEFTLFAAVALTRWWKIERPCRNCKSAWLGRIHVVNVWMKREPRIQAWMLREGFAFVMDSYLR